ncbi:MAG TPA: peptide chain release factor 3 [Spirochaetota bacterium]|nr:peptide chain release factor 3 [Spirochaetota bacterium]HPN82537.1 peptide chain release factor 3 [Spirochaetota bacterium]
MDRLQEIARRRTFAIVSHPDAGKTTLTEKLLLFGGAIQVAGAVKSNKIKRAATSDFMEIEKQRGISVATSVMAFEYGGLKINILDTPGHQDFVEDTFRTLTVVDSVIVVVDSAKGVEAQTEKLMEVCRRRHTPVIVFINKLDRDGLDPFDVLDELESKLSITVSPMTWPAGMGHAFRGVWNRHTNRFCIFSPHGKQEEGDVVVVDDVRSPVLGQRLGHAAEKLVEDLDMVSGVYPGFDRERWLKGEIAPVFFGSAINNFGVKELLDCFVDIAPPPGPVAAEEREVHPQEQKFTGFVFKIHANMDPRHRDRLAFFRIVSGSFQRNEAYYHVRLDRQLRFSSPHAFLADKKEIVDEAFPGDIVGLPDSGNFKLGDTLTAGEVLHYRGVPSFAPEHFRYVDNADPMRAKQLSKGLAELLDEGVAQLFTSLTSGRKIIGTVGVLQLEVLQYRLEHEYNAKCRYQPIEMHKACWVSSEDPAVLAEFRAKREASCALDRHGRLVFLAHSAWAIKLAQDDFPRVQFHYSSEF